jgi:hypothetical protein
LGRLQPVARSKMAEARAGVAASLGVGPSVPPSRPVRGWSRPRTLLFDVRSSRPAWPAVPPRRSTSTHPSGAQGLPPVWVGARAPAHPLWKPGPSRAPACVSRRADRVRAVRVAFAKRADRVDRASRRDGPETSAQGRATPLARCTRSGERAWLAPSSLAAPLPLRPGASSLGLAPFERWAPDHCRDLRYRSVPRIRPRPRTPAAGVPEGTPSNEQSSVSGSSLRSFPGRSCIGHPCAGIIGSLR